MSQSRTSKDTLSKAQNLLNKLMGQNIPGKAMQQATVSSFSNPSSQNSNTSSASSTSSQSSTLSTLSTTVSMSSALSTESKEKNDEPLVDISKDEHDLAAIDYLKGQRPEILNATLGLAIEKKHVRACALLLSVNAYHFTAKEIFDHRLLPANIRDEITRRVRAYKSMDQIFLLQEDMLKPKAQVTKNPTSPATTIPPSSPATTATEHKQSTGNFLEIKNIPLAVIDNHVALYLTLADMGRARRATKGSRSSGMFAQSNAYQRRAAEILLKCVLYGNEAGLISILKADKGAISALFATPERPVNDHIEVIHLIRPVQMSPIMAMRCGGDPYMMNAIEPFLDQIPNGRVRAHAILEQFVEAKKEVNPFDYTQLVAAITADPCTDGKVTLPATEEKLAALKAHYYREGVVITKEEIFAAKFIYARALDTYSQNWDAWIWQKCAVYEERVLGLLQSLFTACLAQATRIGWANLVKDEAAPFSRVVITFSINSDDRDLFLARDFLFDIDGRGEIDVPRSFCGGVPRCIFQSLCRDTESELSAITRRLQKSRAARGDGPTINR